MIQDEDGIYYDANLTNDLTVPIKCSISNRLDNSLLDRPRDYKLIITKFQCDASNIPLFFPIIPNAGFPNTTNTSITLSYAGLFYQQFLVVSNNELSFGVFDVGIYLEHLNDASILAFTALKAANPGASGSEAPRFYYNPKTLLISMYTQDAYLETNVNRISIGVNQSMEFLLDLPASTFLGVNQPNGYDYILAVRGYGEILPVAPRSGYPYALSALGGTWIQQSQELQSMSNWNFIKSILFATSMPVIKEYLPTMLGSGQNINVGGNSMSVVAHFDLTRDNVDFTRGIFQYIPSAEFKRITMTGTNPLSLVDLQTYYQTEDGTIRPIFLSPGGNMSMQIFFEKMRSY
jgi:hypothetical protein